MSNNNVAVITGGSKGIGRALTDLFIEKGFIVYTSSRDISELENLNEPRIKALSADLSKKEEVLRFGKWIEESTDKVDVLINNVGVFIPGKLTEEDDGLFEQQVNLNLGATYHLTRSVLPLIRKSNKGHIFNICSTASITPYINGGSYCISKYAQYGLTKVLREELKPEKIKVSAVLPGATLTDSWRGTDLPEDRFIKPATVAQLIWSAYKVEDFSVMEEILIRPLDGDIT
ncbi:SDR family oxidoreductase [bacterium]|nr:SDR family oxidoreductase [bacterium]